MRHPRLDYFVYRVTIGAMKMKLLSITMALFLGAGASAIADDKEEMTKEVTEAIALFKKADPDLKKFFDSAKAYAVFPSIAKGGFGIGAARGKGHLLEKGKATGDTTMTQGSIGLQAGGQVYAELIFFESDSTLTNFKESKMEFSAQVSAVAATAGASKNAKYEHGVAVFTLAKGGLMYEASVGGQKFKYKKFK